MKMKLLFAVFVTLISATLFGQEIEKQAILKTARNETDAYYKSNFKRMAILPD
jgi:hypothetical protein